MVTVKPTADTSISSTFFFPNPEALHAKDSWPASLMGSSNAPGSLCSISSKGQAADDKKKLWQKIMFFLRRTFCASNRFAYVGRSTPRKVSFDVPAIKKSIPGDPVQDEARDKIKTLDKELRLLQLHYKKYAEASPKGDHSLLQMCEIRQTSQSLLNDCIILKDALGIDSASDIGLADLIAAYQSL